MRIVTRPDFDGVVCAVLLYEAEDVSGPVLWVEPGDIQSGKAEIEKGDILSNLPYDSRCALWFDHHYSNQTDQPFEGAFRIAPSAAGIIFDYYQDRFEPDYGELVAATDKIDSADFTKNDILCPERNPYILLSMTISGQADTESDYWSKLIDLLRGADIARVMSDEEVAKRCEQTVAENSEFESLLIQHTALKQQVSVTDFRGLATPPRGNRFLVYSLYPDTNVNVCILPKASDPSRIMVKIGHSILRRDCQVNVGRLLAGYGGGGHEGAGSCSFPLENAQKHIDDIIDKLLKNRPGG